MGRVYTSALAYGKSGRILSTGSISSLENVYAYILERWPLGSCRNDDERIYGKQVHCLCIPFYHLLPTHHSLQTLSAQCGPSISSKLDKPGCVAFRRIGSGTLPFGIDRHMWNCIHRTSWEGTTRAMKKLKQICAITAYNFRLWRANPRIIVTFALTFIMSFLLTDKAVRFAIDHNTTMQMVESFIWSFGDSNSILLSSVLLVLLFADMPFLSSGTPFYLVRTDRRTWITGQVVYILAATTIYLIFVLASTVILSIQQSFAANMWSPTAAILGYTNAGERVAIPALVKTLEMSWPYQSMISIFGLMLGYTSVMVLLMLACNLRFGQAAGVVSVLVFSLYGILMQPDTIQLILKLPDEAYYIANVIIGWLSPLNQATYHMHNFGYDKLPRLWQSYCIFIGLSVILYFASIRAAKRYNFSFTGTEG